MTSHINQSINQSIKLFKKYSLLIDRGRKLGEGKKKRKNCLDWGFGPQTWKHGTGTATVYWIAAQSRHAVKPHCRGEQGKRPMIAYCLTQCSNGSSLGSLLFTRQDNHVQRCTHYTSVEPRASDGDRVSAFGNFICAVFWIFPALFSLRLNSTKKIRWPANDNDELG